jgi:hypothetical protein
MANPLFNMLNGQQPQIKNQMAMPITRSPQFLNPIQRMNYILQAMQNPVAFIRQNLPGIPDEAYNDPTGNSILRYMMNNMGVTQLDVQNAANQIPKV